MQQLSRCVENLDRLEQEASDRAEAFGSELSGAMKNAEERLSRAEKGVTRWQQFCADFDELKDKVQKEMEDAVDYLDQVSMIG